MSNREFTIRKVNEYSTVEIHFEYNDSVLNEINAGNWDNLRKMINETMKRDHEEHIKS